MPDLAFPWAGETPDRWRPTHCTLAQLVRAYRDVQLRRERREVAGAGTTD